MCQIRTQKYNPRGRRFTLDDKILALSLFKQSGKGYRLLAKCFSLPSRATIMKLLQKIPFLPGINERIFHHLSETVKTLKNKEKNCVLLMDEMALSANLNYNRTKDMIEGFQDLGNGRRKPVFSNHATVFMVRGVYRKFKQPVAFMLCENATDKINLKNMIIDIVRALRNTGLHIIATISDQGTNNVAAINSLLHETSETYIRRQEEKRHVGYEVDGINIVHLYDPPHLLKGVRNNMITKNIYFDHQGKRKIAKWDHIVQFYNFDQIADDLRLCPKLTEQHIIPAKIKKMKVAYAAQVMSQRVSAIMRRFAGCIGEY